MATGMGKKAASVACLVLACSSGDAEIGRRSSGGSDESASIAQAAEAPPFAVPTDGILASQAFGTIEGNSNVGEDGSFNYEVPLSVPEGRAGLTPSVLLRYSSRGGNGLVGVGWSTVAASRIARCKRTLARDGITAGIDFNTDFRVALNHYCLDGQALFPTRERTEATVVFRTEHADFSRIVGVYRDTENPTYSGDPLYFIVYDQNGRIHEYGSRNAENNSRAEAKRYLESGALAATVAPYAWNLSRSTDRSGNAISYFYDKAASAERILKTITYTSRLTDAPALAYQIPGCG